MTGCKYIDLSAWPMCHKIHRQVKLLERLTTRVEFCVIISGSNNSYAWFNW